MASVGAGRGCGGLCPRPLPRQGGGLGLGDFLPVGGRLGGRGGGRPWLHSGGSSPVYLVPPWALFSSVRSRMGWALVSSRVSPSGLSGALLPWPCLFLAVPDHPDLWPPVVPRVAEAVLDRALTPDPVACVVVAEGLLDLRALFESWVRLGRGRCWLREEDDEDAWSGWGGSNDGREDDEDAWSGFAGLVGWGAGGSEVAAFPAWLGAGSPLFRLARLNGTGGSGAGGAWGLKKGCVACWPGSLSGGSAGVCMFAFAWLRMRSASLRTVSGGRDGHGSAAGLSSKGW